MKNRRSFIRSSRGISLIIIMMIMVFLLIVGLVLMTVTGVSKETAGNIRQYQQAFNAAEAGFDDAWTQLNVNFNALTWSDFSGHYLPTLGDLDSNPASANFFRKRSDTQILGSINAATQGVLFYQTAYIAGEQRYAYTAFLVDKALMTSGANPKEALLVVIGCLRNATGGTILATSRIEVDLTL